MLISHRTRRAVSLNGKTVGTIADLMTSCCLAEWRSYRRHITILSFLVLIGFSRSLQAQSFNPNGFDAVKTMNEILHPQSDLVLVSSHRGLHALVNGNDARVPENSLEAIGRSAQAGNEEIELDVKLTSDGVPILSHDLSWGREWCGAYVTNPSPFDPFTAPGATANDNKNPTVTATSLANTRSFFGTTELRDTISLIDNSDGRHGCGFSTQFFGVYPPTLVDVLAYMKANHIAMVLALDIRDADTAKAAWRQIAGTLDYRDRSYALSTLFKIPAKAFSSPQDVEAAFSNIPGPKYAYFQPVYNTSDIESTSATTSDSLLDFGGTDVNPVRPIIEVSCKLAWKRPASKCSI